MLGKKSRPVIAKLAGAWGSGDKSGFTEAPDTSPRSPLDVKIPSPRGLKNFHDLGGVGLGIVAALEKSGDSGSEIRANKPVFVRNLSRNSDPIPVKLPPNNSNCGGYRRGLEEMELDDDLEEDYTFVTFHGPNKAYKTRVYCDNGVEIGRSGHDGIGFDRRSKNCGYVAVFDVSPARFGEDTRANPGSDFLSSCHLCQKKLHGKDIYMYRGERAFCSTECRYRQIVTDERKEQCCSSEASRSAAADVSNSPYTDGQIFTTGILAI